MTKHFSPSQDFLTCLEPIEDGFMQQVTSFDLQGGYVEFSFLDQTYSHFFISPNAINNLKIYLQPGKPLEGLRNYIKHYYAPMELGIQLPDKEPIIIWNFEFSPAL